MKQLFNYKVHALNCKYKRYLSFILQNSFDERFTNEISHYTQLSNKRYLILTLKTLNTFHMNM